MWVHFGHEAYSKLQYTTSTSLPKLRQNLWTVHCSQCTRVVLLCEKIYAVVCENALRVLIVFTVLYEPYAILLTVFVIGSVLAYFCSQFCGVFRISVVQCFHRLKQSRTFRQVLDKKEMLGKSHLLWEYLSTYDSMPFKVGEKYHFKIKNFS